VRPLHLLQKEAGDRAAADLAQETSLTSGENERSDWPARNVGEFCAKRNFAAEGKSYASLSSSTPHH